MIPSLDSSIELMSQRIHWYVVSMMMSVTRVALERGDAIKQRPSVAVSLDL